MSLKKIALIALIVVLLLSSVIAFGCKPKAQEEPAVETEEIVDSVAVDSVEAPAEEAPVTP